MCDPVGAASYIKGKIEYQEAAQGQCGAGGA
jgi:hypothetical protein